MGNIILVNSYPALSLLTSSLAYILLMGGRFLTSGGSEPPPASPPRGLFISLAVLLLMVSIAIVLVTVFVFCCRRRSHRAGSESEHTVPSPLPGDRCCAGDSFPVETGLPAFPYAAEGGEHGGSSARECAVCLGAVEEGEMVRQLPACKHLYHVVCIDQWLAARRTCPVCRSQLDLCLVGLHPQAPVLDEDDAHAPDEPPV